MPVLVQYLQALTVPAIAAFGIYIAWRQWLTAHASDGTRRFFLTK